MPELSQRGGLAVAVPGEVRGLGEMVRRWGKLPFRRCVEPAQKLAARGFPVSSRLAASLAGARPPRRRAARRRNVAVRARCSAAKPLRGGRHLAPPRSGLDAGQAARRVRTPSTRARSRTRSSTAVRAAGGVMTAEDLASYATVERTPLETDYRGLRVASMPPPSSGGIALIETLGILAARYPSGPAAAARDARQRRAAARAGRGVQARLRRPRALPGRHRTSSPSTWRTWPAPAYHAELARRIKPGAVLPRDAYGTLGPPPRAAARTRGRRTCR